MKHSIWALSIPLIWASGVACFGQASAPASITGPTEVGISKMPPGHYEVIEHDSGKRYQLTVTTKGSMILSPGKVAPAVTNVSGVTAAAPAAVPAATAVVPGAVPVAAPGKSSMQRLMEKGMQQGMKEIMRKGGTKQLQNLIK